MGKRTLNHDEASFSQEEFLEQKKMPIKGRGANENLPNRFEKLILEKNSDEPDTEWNPQTVYLKEKAKKAISTNDSPDVGMNTTFNPYRGCEHGCIYCYARPTHEYLGFSAGLDFETKIIVKENAPELLKKELSAKSWVPQVVGLSGVTDCYQPLERKLQLTRRCLKIFAEFRNPVFIITKNHLITRDLDVLKELASFQGVGVILSVTSLNPEISRVMEPRASQPQMRLDAIRELNENKIPVGVNVAPVVPGLTDHEMPKIIEAAAKAGGSFGGFVPLRLPFGVKVLFEHWVEQHFPDRKDKILNRIREIRGGKLNDPNFNSRMEGEGIFAKQMEDLFVLYSKKFGLGHGPELSARSFRIPPGDQLDLFFN